MITETHAGDATQKYTPIPETPNTYKLIYTQTIIHISTHYNSNTITPTHSQRTHRRNYTNGQTQSRGEDRSTALDMLVHTCIYTHGIKQTFQMH